MPGHAVAETLIDDDAMEFGQIYRSTVMADVDPGLPAALRADQWAGQPGTRAPHLWVESGGARMSTLDLFQPDWVLLAGHDGWRQPLVDVGRTLRIPVRCFVFGADVHASEPTSPQPSASIREARRWSVPTATSHGDRMRRRTISNAR